MSSLCTNLIKLGVTDSEWKELVQSFKDEVIEWPLTYDGPDFFDESKSIYFSCKNYPKAWEEGYMAALSKAYPTVVFYYSAKIEYGGMRGTWFCDGIETNKSEAQIIKKDVYKREYERFLFATAQGAEGVMHKVQISSDGCVFAEGKNRYGECNCNTSTWSDIKKISCGNWHTVGLKDDGTVLTCGSNYNGQCDIPDIDEKIVDISCGRYHTAYLLESGRVLVIGEVQGEAPDPSPEWEMRSNYLHSKPIEKDKFPYDAELRIDKHMKGWKQMNEAIERISVGDEVTLKPSKDSRIDMLVFDKDENPLGQIFCFGLGDATCMNHIKATVKDVTPLSKRRKGSKYAKLTVGVEYVEKGKEYYKRMIQAGPTSHWPNVKEIKSVFDAVAGITESGEMFIEGYCPCSRAEIMEFFEKE